MNWGLLKSRSTGRSAPSKGGVSDAALADFDTQLMMQASTGNQHAFSRLFERTSQSVSSYICRMLPDPRAAEELTQDVYVTLWNRAAEYKPRAKVITWLYHLATYAVIEHIRSRQPKSAAFDEAQLAGTLEDPHATAPDLRMNCAELRQKLEAALQLLTPNQRAVLILFQTEQQSYEEIAEILGITAHAVKSLLNRARERMRELIVDIQ